MLGTAMELLQTFEHINLCAYMVRVIRTNQEMAKVPTNILQGYNYKIFTLAKEQAA